MQALSVILQQVWMIFQQPEAVPAQLYCSAPAWVALRAHWQIYSGFFGHRHCVKAYPCPVVGFLPPLIGSWFCQQLGPAFSKYHIFIPSLVSVLERFVEGRVPGGRQFPYILLHVLMSCVCHSQMTQHVADVIYGVLCQIYQKICNISIYHVVFWGNLPLSFGKLIPDCIFLIVCISGVRESGWGEEA